jgi:bifunctional DNA-binding transcriptional regulator/antitoxin component of YhaV-PrlF toxin-antitoxin module
MPPRCILRIDGIAEFCQTENQTVGKKYITVRKETAMAERTVEMAQRGQITIPKDMRSRHHWDVGQHFTLIDLDGVVVMSPRHSEIDVLANRLRDDLLADGMTLETMVAEIRREREGGAAP